MARPRFRSVFTPAGCAVLFISLFILIRSLYARNSYEILLSSAALFFLLVLGITGVWRSKKLKNLEPGWKPPFPLTANAKEETLVTGMNSLTSAGGSLAPWFFRLHFIARGRFYPAGFTASGEKKKSLSGQPVFAETSVPRGGDTARLDLNFPMSGIFLGEGYCRLKDIFGLFSFSCGVLQSKTLKIRNAPYFGTNFYINAQSGAEDRRNKTSSDEERYYMREYAPGDRFRDINWKSSEKIDTLITRISPDNQEKVSRLEVFFRNYGAVKRPSLEALWLLDRAKAGLSRFLRSFLLKEQSSLIFNVRAAQGNWEIKEEEELEDFLEELAGISFSPPVNETISTNRATGELYVFSTACDTSLPAFLLACQPRPVSLFLAQSTERRKGFNKVETISIRDFLAKGCIPSPRWIIPGKIKQLGVTASRLEINYAETRL